MQAIGAYALVITQKTHDASSLAVTTGSVWSEKKWGHLIQIMPSPLDVPAAGKGGKESK